MMTAPLTPDQRSAMSTLTSLNGRASADLLDVERQAGQAITSFPVRGRRVGVYHD